MQEKRKSWLETPEHQMYLIVIDARRSAERAKLSMLAAKTSSINHRRSSPPYRAFYRLAAQLALGPFFTLH